MIKNKKNFKILLVYPNLPLMLVPPLSMAIFTKILKEKKHEVELFDTTPYIPEDVNSSPQNRTIYLQARQFSDEDDLGVSIKTNLLGDYKDKITLCISEIKIYDIGDELWKIDYQMAPQPYLLINEGVEWLKEKKKLKKSR